jgi:hypothetical protein
MASPQQGSELGASRLGDDAETRRPTHDALDNRSHGASQAYDPALYHTDLMATMFARCLTI